MASDPKLLYAIEGINAYLLHNGQEERLTPTGPQTLSLLMVPTSSGFADPASQGTGEEDYYLHLHLPPELDLPLPATTQIYHQPPTSYLIPRWDLGPDSGAFTRIEFPAVGSRTNVQEDVDTFETILAQCTAFLERASFPVAGHRSEKSAHGQSDAARAKAREAGEEALPAYNPADFKAGEGYAQGSQSGPGHGGRIVLVDEEDGSVVGELGEGFQLVAENAVQPGSKDPVIVTLPQDGSQNIVIGPAPHEYISKDMHPAYQKSSLVNRATKASQLFVTTSDFVTRSMQAGADNFAKSTKPVKPVTFTPTTHENIRRINTFSTQAATLSATTVGTITKYAQNFGASVAKRKDGRARGFDKDGNPIATYKPGVLNKSLMAFNTVVDGVEQAGRNLLQGTSSSVSQVVGHRWGEEAGEVAGHIGGGFKNVGLVYIDVTGVSRRAILKSVAKGMVVGNVKGGGQVVVGGNGSGNASVNASTDDVTKSSGKASPHAASGALGNESQASGRYTAQSEYADTASIASGRPLLDRQTSSKSASKPNYY